MPLIQKLAWHSHRVVVMNSVDRDERRTRTMTRMLIGVTLALGMILCATHAVTASGALIETTAPLSDRSEEALKTAVVAAIDQAVRGATAMGFAWVQLQDARVSEHEVVIQILATDQEPDEVTPSPSEESDGDLSGEPVPGPAPSGRVPI
jgi:hypothetical protein